jgi:hypothetical protein
MGLSALPEARDVLQTWCFLKLTTNISQAVLRAFCLGQTSKCAAK